MSRVDELVKKYPTIPREVVVKYEVLGRGIRDNEILDRAGYWTRSHGVGTYQSYDLDVTPKELAEKRPGRVRPGYILRVDPMFTKVGLGIRIQRDSASPYELKELAPGQFALFEGEEKVEDVKFPSHERWAAAEELVTSKGRPATSLVTLNRNCFRIVPTRHCEYFSTGEQCKFCNYNQTQADARAIGAPRDVMINLEETLEAYKLISSEVELVEGQFQMGGFLDKEQEAKIYFGYVEALANLGPNILAVTQPMTRKDLQRFEDIGVNCICHPMEVWDPQLFAEVCPGKANHRGRELFLEAYLEAVEIFGAGNAVAAFVGGVTLMPANGHKTWQEARDAHIEGNTWMIKNGILPSFTTLRLGPGSIYGNDKSNRTKIPPTEYYLEVAQAHDQSMEECGFYPKVNKLACCVFCVGPQVYCGEIGMLRQVGNLANWMADAVKEEQNWLREVCTVDNPA